jgi:hypothetical protein
MIGDPLGGTLFFLAHFCALRPTIVTHPTYVFPSLVDDTHIIGPASNVVPTFLLIRRVISIKFFNVVNKMCSLVSSGVRPLYINSSKLFYS